MEITWVSVACPLCAGWEWQHKIESPDYLAGSAEVFHVVQCTACKMVFTNPRPAAASMQPFYAPAYKPHQAHSWDLSIRSSWKQYLEYAVLRSYYGYPPQPPNWHTRCLGIAGKIRLWRRKQRFSWISYTDAGRLLDFGCGAGRFSRKMKAYGWEVHAIDPKPAVSAIAQSEGIHLHTGSLPHPDIAPESFDVITMWDVLEHVPQPRQVLKAAYDALRPCGRLILGLPNFKSWSCDKLGAFWYGLELPLHLSHFSPHTLTQMLQLEDFHDIHIQQVGRASWMCHSAKRVPREFPATFCIRMLSMRPLAEIMAFWTQRIKRADYMHVTALKIPDLGSRTSCVGASEK